MIEGASSLFLSFHAMILSNKSERASTNGNFRRVKEWNNFKYFLFSKLDGDDDAKCFLFAVKDLNSCLVTFS